MKQTAIEYLEKRFQSLGFDFEHILKEAKSMEKEQIMDAYSEGDVNGIMDNEIRAEQYYNETFKSE